jgi:hypothetical protein
MEVSPLRALTPVIIAVFLMLSIRRNGSKPVEGIDTTAEAAKQNF